MIALLNRRELKDRAAALLDTARVSAKGMTALYMGLLALLSMIIYLSNDLLGVNFLPYLFVRILLILLSLALDAGFTLYCMAVRRGEETDYLILFDGIGLAGKIIMLEMVKWLFIGLWSMFFIFPGVIAAYRYRFALLNLLENPKLDFMEALGMSKRQTYGYKGQLLGLDASYVLWGLLEIFPQLVYSYGISAALVNLTPDSAEFWAASQALSESVLGIPVVAWQLIISLWAVAIAVFYRPNYICVTLDYFDAAKLTSGVGEPPVFRPSPSMDASSVFTPFSQKGESYDYHQGGRIMKKYVCDPCGYVYDPAEGDPDNGVAPGTAFEDIPDDWTCPVCGAGKDEFKPEE